MGIRRWVNRSNDENARRDGGSDIKSVSGDHRTTSSQSPSRSAGLSKRTYFNGERVAANG